jgi:hypothetical protein
LGEFVDDPAIFHCPVDEESVDSYSKYYVTRTGFDAGDSLLVGCPRHDNQTLAVNVFKKGAASTHPLGQMYHSAGSQSEPVGAGEIVSSGTTWFPDGSSMTITTPGLEAEVVESFRLDSGQTYTLLKVPANDTLGRLILNVIPGSRFEVITPAAIAGVRGTVFIVDIIPKDGRKATDVFVYEGEVAVTEKTGKGERLSSWGVPICCEEAKPPYLSPDPVPALPGIPESSIQKPVKIERENPPWAMGKNPWPDGVPPWAPANGYRDKTGTTDDTDPKLAKHDQGNDEGQGSDDKGSGNPANDPKDDPKTDPQQDKPDQPGDETPGANGRKSEENPGDGGSTGQTPPSTGDDNPSNSGPDEGADVNPNDGTGDQDGPMVTVGGGNNRRIVLPRNLRPVYRRYALARGSVPYDAPWGGLGFLIWLISILRPIFGF